MSIGTALLSLIGLLLVVTPVRTLLRYDRKLGYVIYKFSENETQGLRYAKTFYCALGIVLLAYAAFLVAHA